MKMSNTYSPPKILKMLFIGFVALGTLAGAAMFYLENSFLWHARSPQPELGRTVAYAFKGAIFFITPDEHFWIKLIYYVFTACLVCALGVAVYLSAKMGFPIKGER